NRIYETKDGKYIVLAGSERKFSENLLRTPNGLDFLDLAAGEPGPSQQPLIAFFTETFNTKTRPEWEAFLEPIALRWGPVRSLKEGFEDPQAQARGMLVRDAHGNPNIGPAIKFQNEPAEPNF